MPLNVFLYGAFAGYHKNLIFKELLISQCICILYTKVSYLSNFLGFIFITVVLARLAGIEPATHGLEGRCSIP
jgi:hypothetical protein